MTAGAALGGYLVLLALGDTLLAWLRQGEPPIGIGERAALAFGLGAGAVSLLLFWGSLLAPGRVGASFVLVPAGAIVGARLVLGRPVVPRLPTLDRWSGIALFVLPSLGFASLLATVREGLSGDGLVIWGLKARIAFLAHGVPLDYLHDVSRQWSHLDYPWLLPLDEAWFSFLAGEPSEVLAKTLGPAFFLAVLLLFNAGARRFVSPRWGLLGAVALAVLPQFFFWTTEGYADLLLAFYGLASVLALLVWHEGGRVRDLVLGSVFAGLAAWTKREGLVLAAVQALAITGGLLRGKKTGEILRGLAAHALIVGVIAGPWLFLAVRAHAPANDFAPGAHWERLPAILGMLGKEACRTSHWGLLGYLVALAAVFPSRGRWVRLYVGLSFALPLGALLVSYVFSVWPLWEKHVETSLSRLLVQQAPLAVLFVVAGLGPLVDVSPDDGASLRT